MREYNTTGVCIPSKHYMVDISDKVAEIRKMIDSGYYFTINRGRQYGKTTTLFELYDALMTQYVVISMSFERISESGFKDEHSFVEEFCRLLRREFRREPRIPNNIREEIDTLFKQSDGKASLGDLFDVILEWCNETEAPVVLIIDEIDYATNFQVFLDFLAQLRAGYISRNIEGIPTFQSVIFAGVTDVSLLGRIHGEDQCWTYIPWNIATDFDIDMSLSEAGIKGMLDEYEADYQTGMDTGSIAKLIREYTNGYPFLVSRICQLIDKQVVKNTGVAVAWTHAGLYEAIKLLLFDDNTLFYLLMSNLKNYPDLKDAIRSILMEGKWLAYNEYQDGVALMQMYGLIVDDHGMVRVANRVFEMRLYNLFLSDEELKGNVFCREGDLARNAFVQDGRLDMRLVLEGFTDTYEKVFKPLEDRFKEKDGRELFLLYLRPIIIEMGNYYIESQTRDQTCMDVIIDYLGQQYIVELKIWHGSGYNAEGEKQISDYLDYFGLTTGYMLSFNFNKEKKKGLQQVYIGDKLLYEFIL